MTVRRSRRPLGDDNDAVAPIIGVLLAVGITVVLAGVVYVVSTSLTSGSQRQHIAPRIGFVRIASGLQVASAPNNPPVSWGSDVQAGGTCWANHHLLLTPQGQPQQAFPGSSTPIAVSPGDVVGGCSQGETVVLKHGETNTVVYDYQF